MKKTNIALLIVIVCISLSIAVYAIFQPVKFNVQNYSRIQRPPRIEPGYSGSVIPPNIAPLNFLIKEPGTRCHVEISSTNGGNIEISSKTPKIVIPLARWKKMLSLNRGQEIHFDIFVEKENGAWERFGRITNRIAHEDIDNFLVYRLIKPLYIKWQDMGIYQRNLQNYDESIILHNRTLDNACINCHTFHKNSADMILHTRAGAGTGMLMYRGQTVVKVNTKTDFSGHAAYASWHPNGKLIAFAAIKVNQFFHATGENRDVIDTASDLAVYRIDSNSITTSPKISSPDRMETYPAWSADGEYLYFCSAPKYNPDIHFSKQYKTILYDLMRIGYDPESGAWGKPETVLAASETGLSITHPAISPDGRFLLFCMSEYGNFSIYNPDSDLYLMDLKSGRYHRPDINSNRAESYHSWSANSRWFVFSSKRDDGLCARPYLCYVDQEGKVSNPFLLPQKDPAFYDSFIKTYNRPELINEPVKVSPRVLTKVCYETDAILNAEFTP